MCLFLKIQKGHYIPATNLQSSYNNVYLKYIDLLDTLFVMLVINIFKVTLGMFVGFVTLGYLVTW